MFVEKYLASAGLWKIVKEWSIGVSVRPSDRQTEEMDWGIFAMNDVFRNDCGVWKPQNAFDEVRSRSVLDADSRCFFAEVLLATIRNLSFCDIRPSHA